MRIILVNYLVLKIFFHNGFLEFASLVRIVAIFAFGKIGPWEVLAPSHHPTTPQILNSTHSGQTKIKTKFMYQSLNKKS